MDRWWRTTLRREVARLRQDGRAGVLWSLRITVAAVAGYLVGLLLFPGTQPLLAPLTAMLVIQVTPVSLLASGLDRVIAVVAGVSIAVTFAAVVPLEWWSLGLLILVSVTLGQVLHLGDNLLEVAISGMLVLGVGSLGAQTAAWARITETLVGAAVGVAVNLAFPAKVANDDAGRAIDGLADSITALLNRAADELTAVAGHPRDVIREAKDWLDEARLITYDIPRVGAALLHAEQGRRLNVRAVGTADVGPGLRQGLEALEHSAVAVRGLFRALLDATYDGEWLDHEIAEDVLLGLAQTCRELAVGVDAFGQLVRDEADPATRVTAADIDELRHGLQGMHDARARLEDSLTAGTDPELLELDAALLSTVKRVLREIDIDERARRQLRLMRPVRPRPHRPAGLRAGASGAPREAEPGPEPDASPDAATEVLPASPNWRDLYS